MTVDITIDRFVPASRKAFALGLVFVLSVLLATVLAGVLYFRGIVRVQIASRDADSLYATTLMQQLDARSRVEGDLGDEQVGFEAALLASRLKGVLGIRFFDEDGQFKDSFPANIQPKKLAAWAREPLARRKPSSSFAPEMPLDQVFIYRPEFASGKIARVPILEIVVPLLKRDSTNIVGSAQFVIEGQSIAEEYARLDRNLAVMAALAIFLAGAILILLLWPIFRRLERANAELALRSERLLRANQELALAARTSALGAVSAHLMHGLKNPLASLSQYLCERVGSPGDPVEAGDSHDALSAARRMQALVEETLEVISDARGEPGYETTVSELLETVSRALSKRHANPAVLLDIRAKREVSLPSRTANLVKLVLVNLGDNAIEATPVGRSVSISAELQDGSVLFSVRDQGCGFPEHLRPSLFLPCRSTRQGGAGVGLAISRQIAEHLGAKLELIETSEAGSVLILKLPLDEQSGHEDLKRA